MVMAAEKIYLDACCVMRLNDDQSQSRIRMETDAVRTIIRLVAQGAVVWTGGSALTAEIESGPETEFRREALQICAQFSVPCVFSERVKLRAKLLYELGFGELDAIHLASAENSACLVLLTTDDRFVKRRRNAEAS